MMGSSTNKELAALDAVLAIVTNPDMLAKNIEALKEKIVKSEEAAQIARQEQDSAKETKAALAQSLADIEPRARELDDKENALKAREVKLGSYKASLDDIADELKGREETHRSNAKDLEVREAKLKAKEDSLADRLGAAEAKLKAREDKLKSREADADKRDALFADKEEEHRQKLETAKKLWS